VKKKTKTAEAKFTEVERHQYDGPWELEEALALCRKLWEPMKIAGYHVGLTGSVLYNGQSQKDLDLIVYPRESKGPKEDFMGAYGVLAAFRFKLVAEAGSNDDSHTDRKTVKVFQRKSRRIDVFFLR
jgi:hypothetical protein